MWNEKKNKRERGKRNNLKLVWETVYRKLILTVLAYLHLRPDFKSYSCHIEKKNNTMWFYSKSNKKPILKSAELSYIQIPD